MVERLVFNRIFAFGFPVLLFLAVQLPFSWVEAACPTLHFLGGLSMGIICAHFWETHQDFYSFKKVRWLNLIVILSFVSLAGLIWELYEFSHDKLFLANQAIPYQDGLRDTMEDLFLDLCGGLGWVLVYFNSNLYKK